MKPSQRRKRLFAKTRPTITMVTQDNGLELINWLWVAYNLGGDAEMEEMDFKKYAYSYLAGFDVLFTLVDHNPKFSTGEGPVGYVGATYDGWNFRPHVEWYSWASARNRLRCTVAFLTKTRHRRDVGIILLNTADPTWCKGLRKYIGIYKQGTIRKGRPDGSDEHTFYIRGNSHGIHKQPAGQRHERDDNGSIEHPAGEPDLSAAAHSAGQPLSH